MPKRRGPGEGSITHRTDGRWMARLTVGTKPDGKPLVWYAYGDTRKEVAEKLAGAIAVHNKGEPIIATKQTVAEYLDYWLDTVVKPRRRPRTYDSYEANVRLYLKPHLGHVNLAKLSAIDVDRMVSALMGRGLSARTVDLARDVLQLALSHAVKRELIGRNVAALVDPPHVPAYEAHPLDAEGARALLAAIRGHPLEALCVTTVALGLRQGEALGLRWTDVDLEDATVRIAHELQRIEGKWQLNEPKSARSRRTLPLPAFLVALLREHRARQVAHAAELGERWRGAEWNLVFPTYYGEPQHGTSVTNSFRRFLAEAGLAQMRFHDLRHSCATLMALQGVNMRVAMEILGHSQISVTANIYTHVVTEETRDAMARMDRLLGSGNASESHLSQGNGSGDAAGQK